MGGMANPTREEPKVTVEKDDGQVDSDVRALPFGSFCIVLARF